MRTREEVARVLNEVSNQLIELTLYDLQGEERDHVSNISSMIDGVWEDIMEELSKNELTALSQETPKESKGHFIDGYCHESQTKEEAQKSEDEAIASGASYSDVYGDFF